MDFLESKHHNLTMVSLQQLFKSIYNGLILFYFKHHFWLIQNTFYCLNNFKNISIAIYMDIVFKKKEEDIILYDFNMFSKFLYGSNVVKHD